MITAAEAVEWEERNENHFSSTKWTASSKTGATLIVPLYQRERKEGREMEGGRTTWRGKDVETRAILSSGTESDRNEVPLYSDVDVKWSRTDEQLWLGTADGGRTCTQGNDET